MEHDTQAALTAEPSSEPLDGAAPAANEMPLYRGTKDLLARPMTRGEYNAYRGWEVPAGEDPAEAGMLVEYIDGGKPNHPGHQGYISWSPKDVFDKAYRLVDAADESDAAFVLRTFGVDPAKYVKAGVLDRALLHHEVEWYRPLFASRVAHGRYA